MAKVSDAMNGGDAASSSRSRRKEAMLCKTDLFMSFMAQTSSDLVVLTVDTAFTSDLQKRLPVDKDDSTAADALLSQVQKQAQTVEKYAEKAHHEMLGDEDLEREGTNLWNLCTRLIRVNTTKPAPDKASAVSKLTLWGRVLAFQILHLCHWSSKSTYSVASHLIRLALKVVRLCIGL